MTSRQYPQGKYSCTCGFPYMYPINILKATINIRGILSKRYSYDDISFRIIKLVQNFMNHRLPTIFSFYKRVGNAAYYIPTPLHIMRDTYYKDILKKDAYRFDVGLRIIRIV